MEQRTTTPGIQTPNQPIGKMPMRGENERDEAGRNASSIETAEAKDSSDESFTHKVGDAIERAGEKLQDMGATKVGQAVYKAGNKIEHSQDNKKN